MTTEIESDKLEPRRFRAKRKGVSVAPEALVSARPLFGHSPLPLLIEPNLKGIDLGGWASLNRSWIDSCLLKHGGILFRDFELNGAAEFEQFIKSVSEELLEYRERSSPRSQIGDTNVYTSTDYPPRYSIFPHNENSYQNVWPLRIFFFCDTAAEQGGETPVADCRAVYRSISTAVRERFKQKQWMYVRNFNDRFGLPWQTVFQTTERAVVEEHCWRRGIQTEWRDGDRLRTRAVRAAIRQHPQTGEWVWFNHATFFHVSTLDPEIRKPLQLEYADQDLPTNTFYGDGSAIEPEILDELREAYRQATVTFSWKKGDLLMLDNMLSAHGRAPYAGQRRILVGMSEASDKAGTKALADRIVV